MISYESKCEFQVKLNTQRDVQDFTEVVSSCPNFIGVFAGEMELDAKSIMGMFSLNLSNPVTITIKSNDKDHNANEYRNLFYPWEVM